MAKKSGNWLAWEKVRKLAGSIIAETYKPVKEGEEAMDLMAFVENIRRTSEKLKELADKEKQKEKAGAHDQAAGQGVQLWRQTGQNGRKS